MRLPYDLPIDAQSDAVARPDFARAAQAPRTLARLGPRASPGPRAQGAQALQGALGLQAQRRSLGHRRMPWALAVQRASPPPHEHEGILQHVSNSLMRRCLWFCAACGPVTHFSDTGMLCAAGLKIPYMAGIQVVLSLSAIFALSGSLENDVGARFI